MKSRHTLACLALAATCTLSVSAAAEPPLTWEWGTNPVYAEETVPFFDGPAFAFERFALFTLDGRFDLLAEVETSGVGDFNVRDGMVTLWRSNGDDDFRNDELIGGFDFGAQPLQQTFAGLGSGDYFYLLEGEATGYGTVWFSSSVAAVPEPGQWALMLAGLCAVAGVARRRPAA